MQRVRAELGVVRADHRQVEQSRGDESADADRSGRRDVHDTRALLFDVGEHVGDQWEMQLQLFVGGERQRPVVRERR